LDKFEKLSEDKINKIKEAFIKNPHVRFVKGFCPYKPFGDKQVYVEKLRQASLKQLAGLTRICGMLMQTKVYLFWAQSDNGIERIIEFCCCLK
jgi:hypothetical protein